MTFRPEMSIPAAEHPFYDVMPEDSMTFIAHRGGNGGLENTMAAFQTAQDRGVT